MTGRVERGVVNVNDEIEITGIKDTQKTVCTGVEMFRKLLDRGEAGDNVGVLLRGTKKKKLKEVKFLLNLDQLNLTENLKQKHIFKQR